MDLCGSSATENAILAVLTGTPIADAAARVRWSPARLADAIDLYRAAGRSALDARPEPSGWQQVNIEFVDYFAAEHAFITHLLPPLRTGKETGVVAAWWFIRKRPCWRLRATPGPNTTADEMIKHLADILDSMVSCGVARRWWPSLYEPETVAFGGREGMKIAHDLFHTDSVGILDYLRRRTTGHRDPLDAKVSSLLLVSLFLRAAGQEWSEQGDVWSRVEAKRPLPEGVSTERASAMELGLQKLFSTDPVPALAADGLLAPLAQWINGLRYSGRSIADAGYEGRLSLGTRAILARHILFHWNRMGFTTRQQAIWARAAREATLGR
ncbi:bacteriocin biosynthesis protein [Streptomyces malaysiensis subsp. malaysiensis]|uniref:thiopeptide-type bacteriocin biosynthesis protein n=1 Tax=Streptomyces malaysiensis TaxID=92644 RepID=UPI000BFD87AE|nr:thiopeptide-type bacteriocin biosynthesis protein [Streptomyces malaysiensis]QDL72849.1 bacteriocin biosynthesis protein [Streptomyces malaysiensis]